MAAPIVGENSIGIRLAWRWPKGVSSRPCSTSAHT